MHLPHAAVKLVLTAARTLPLFVLAVAVGVGGGAAMRATAGHGPLIALLLLTSVVVAIAQQTLP